MKLRQKLLNLFLNRITSNEAEKLIKYIAGKKNISLLENAYHNIGILNDLDEVSGEKYLIESYLKEYLFNDDSLVFFDVGANLGNYTKRLSINFPNAEIHAFEPTKNTFEKLRTAHMDNKNIYPNNMALGNESGNAKIYLYEAEDYNNQHNTLHQEVLTKLFSKTEIISEEIPILTIDNYCSEKRIQKIDFLKIDTEGHEYKILQGANNMIASNRINIIQFEFNEMNIISRVFLKDFYELLQQYSFYRLNTNGLIPLGDYYSLNEIFQFQNIIAINTNIKREEK